MVKVAAIQMKVRDEKDVDRNMTIAQKLLIEAGERGAQLACLPELLLGLFTVEQLPGPSTMKISQIAKDYSMYVVFNMFENVNGKKHNTSSLIGKQGEIIGFYRKIHLFPTEPRLWKDLPGDSWKVFPTDIGKVGMIICNDANYPESTRIETLMGAEIICCSTRMPPPYTHPWRELMIVRSLENQVFIVSAGCHDGAPDTFIVSPHFQKPILSEAPEGDHVIIADLDLDWLQRKRADSPLYHVDSLDSFNTKINEVESHCFLKERRPNLYSELV